jgi:hypothetical protein
VETPTSSDVISMEAAWVDNAVLLDHLISEVSLEDPQITSTIQNILVDHKSTDK